VRAKETAELICSIWKGKAPTPNAHLAAGAAIPAFKSVVVAHKDKKSILIIGHMPDLAHFASAVTSDPWLLDDARMEPAAIWALDAGPFETRWGQGKFLWQRNLSDWKKL
jgi:phosphohistidine phosphatase SixA